MVADEGERATFRNFSCAAARMLPSELPGNFLPSEAQIYFAVGGTEREVRGELFRVSTVRDRSLMIGDVLHFGEDIGGELKRSGVEEEVKRSKVKRRVAELKRSEARDLLSDQVDEVAEHSVACSIVSSIKDATSVQLVLQQYLDTALIEQRRQQCAASC